MALGDNPRSLRLTHFPTDGSAEWLAPKDLALASAVLSAFPQENLQVVEVGVWKGAWSLGVLANVASAEVIGIDPYPGTRGPEARAELELRTALLAVADRFRLTDSRPAAQELLGATRSPVLVHVDGEHTERATTEDLEWAADMLAPGGILILDDHRHAWFPGIPAALHAFLRSRGFRIVLTTEQKAYLCRDEDHAEWYRRFEELLGDGREVEWSHHFGERTGAVSYIEPPDVLGRSVLLAIGKADVLPARQRLAGYIAPRRIARELMPPVIVRLARAGRRILRPGR